MNEIAHITDVTAETFQAQVVARSHQVPVLVDYWADWCGPCQMQMPVLKKLVAEHAGSFLLAKVNTEEQKQLAREHGIRSLPTMRLFKDGEVVEEILGAQTESTLRALLDRYIARPSDALRLSALESWQQGDTETALSKLREAHAVDPDNPRIQLAVAEINLAQGELAVAEAALDALPREFQEEPDVIRLHALLNFARVIQDARPAEVLVQQLREQPSDTEARYQLAAHYVMADQLHAAMDELLHILQHDRKFQDDAGRKGLLAIFDLLGNEGELVNEYRRKLFNAMH